MTNMSIALVTRNRPRSLERTLASLRAQTSQPLEVVVSDDSDDQHQPDVKRLAAAYECRYELGPRRGLYANRNASALACRGSHIRTMDDDHTFPAGHFAACASAIEEDPRAVWIVGECVPETEGSGIEYCSPGQLHPRGHSVAPPATDCSWAIADGASIYPRQVFDDGDRFYEGFVFGASYLEWGSRLYWRGYRMRHLSMTYVVHNFEGRSYESRFTDTASRLFAGLSHSFIYQPTLRNRLLALGELGIVSLRSGSSGVRAASAGIRACTERRKETLAADSQRRSLGAGTADR